MLRLLLAVSLVVGCSSGPAPDPDTLPPVLEITSPERGAISESSSIEVTGQVADDVEVTSVEVNGVAADLDARGRFAVSLNAGAGITLLETVARDAAGNQTLDTRALLAGQLVDLETPVAAALVGRIDARALGSLGELVATVANDLDWSALAKSYNPVAGSGGDSCNSYKAEIESVSHGGFAIETTATDGGIDTSVRAIALEVRGRIYFRTVCVSGSTGFTVTADRLDLDGLIAPSLEGAAIEVDLVGLGTAFTNFDIDVGALPGFVEDHFTPRVRDAVAGIIADRAGDLVPSLATQFISGFFGRTHQMALLERTVGLSVWPSAMSWTETGGTITLDGASTVDGTEGGVYPSSPRQAPADATLGAAGLAVGVADDTLNQLLAAMWQAEAFTDATVPFAADTVDALFGVEGTGLSLTLSLPPVASFDREGAAQLVIGDLLVEAVDPGGESLARFAVSTEIELTARAGGMGMAISSKTPWVAAQILETSPALSAPLDADRIEAIAGVVVGQLAARADELVARIPVPGIAGASLEPEVLDSSGGYLIIGGELGFEY